MYDVIKCNLYIKKLCWIILSKLYICLPIAMLCASIGYIYSQTKITENYYNEIGYYLYSVSEEKIKSYDNGSTIMTSEEFALSNLITSSYINAFKTEPVADYIKEDKKLEYSTQEILDMISCHSVKNTSVIYVQVRGASLKAVNDIADSLAYNIPELVNEIIKVGTIITFEYPADKTGYYISSYTKKYVLLLGGVGFAMPLLIGILLGIRDPIIRTKDELEAITETCVIGEIPYIKTKKRFSKKKGNTIKNSIIYGNDMPQNAIAAFSDLRLFISKLIIKKPNCIIAITSHEKNSGKTFCAINISLSQASIGRKVLLVDANYDGIGIEKSLDISRVKKEHGVTGDYIKDYMNAIIPYMDGIDILTNLNQLEQEKKLLITDKLKKFIYYVKGMYDCIIIDTPSVQSTVNTYLYKDAADAYILIARAEKSSMLGQQEMLKIIDGDEELVYGYILNYAKVNKYKR